MSTVEPTTSSPRGVSETALRNYLKQAVARDELSEALELLEDLEPRVVDSVELSKVREALKMAQDVKDTHAKIPRLAIASFAVAILTSFFASASSVTAALIGAQSPPLSCTQAVQNVATVLDLGMTDPVILGNINPPEVDARCGDESSIKKGLGR